MGARLRMIPLGFALLARAAAAEEIEGVPVTVRSTNPAVELQQQGATSEVVLQGGGHLLTGTSTEWQTVCRVPCDAPIDPRGTFRIGGLDVTPSSAFTMPSKTTAVAIDVHAGSSTQRTAGVVTGSLGLGAMLLGTGFLVAGSNMEPPTSGPLAGPFFAESNAEQASRAAGLRTAGWTTLAVGVVSLVVGIALYASSGTTVDVGAN